MKYRPKAATLRCVTKIVTCLFKHTPTINIFCYTFLFEIKAYLFIGILGNKVFRVKTHCRFDLGMCVI